MNHQLFLPLSIPELAQSYFMLDYTFMNFDDDELSRYLPLFEKAHAAMAKLEAGYTANPDEERMVGHYWLRDPNLAPTIEIKHAIEQSWLMIEEFSKKIHTAVIPSAHEGIAFQNLLVIGIGGSALGPQLLHAALRSTMDRMQIFFMDNTDPDGIADTLTSIKQTAGGLASTLVLVTSKSGGTQEPHNCQVLTEREFTASGLNFSRHAVAITQTGSKLYNQAEDWLARFPLWDFVGGRTSELSVVGLLPAALQGINMQEFLLGAKAMDAYTRRPEFRQNPAALLASCWHSAAQEGCKDMVILPYKDRLQLFPRYLQQLVMESLGKEFDLDGNRVQQGLAVYGNKGSTDQHAYVQQLRDGMHNFTVTFIEVLKEDHQEFSFEEIEEGKTAGDYLLGFLLGTRKALHQKGRQSLTLTLPSVCAYTMGALIALYERAVGYYASFVNINAYHQPGVEAGKQAASDVLSLQKQLFAVLSSTPKTANELSQLCGQPYQQDVSFKLLEHLAVNGRIERQAGTDIRASTYSLKSRIGAVLPKRVTPL